MTVENLSFISRDEQWNMCLAEVSRTHLTLDRKLSYKKVHQQWQLNWLHEVAFQRWDCLVNNTILILGLDLVVIRTGIWFANQSNSWFNKKEGSNNILALLQHTVYHTHALLDKCCWPLHTPPHVQVACINTVQLWPLLLLTGDTCSYRQNQK